MSNTMTKEQQQVVATRNQDLLVAAAAGSGKTWVLVKRIMDKIQNEKVDIHSFLIVTFTKAAAGEMRDRIRNEIETLVEKYPEEKHLQRQLTLVSQAPICTIDSFCASIVKEYFMKIDVDPNYRTADENEMAMMKQEIVEQIIEDFYLEGKEEYLTLLDQYSNGIKTEPIGELILDLHRESVSYNDPISWLDEIPFKMQKEEYFDLIYQYTKEEIEEGIGVLNQLLPYCTVSDGPVKYLDNLKEDLVVLGQLKEAVEKKDFNHLYRLFQSDDLFGKLNRQPNAGCDEKLKQKVSDGRKKVIELVRCCGSRYFFMPLEQMREKTAFMSKSVSVLVTLTKEFQRRFQEQKKTLHILDFQDVEHKALEVLAEEFDNYGKVVPSQIAKDLQNQYEEIMIDEYQDSNYLQEAILSSIAKQNSTCHNMFMVGDMKQSIYRFRQARPELFLSKYNGFASCEEEQKNQMQSKIELNANFRSRKNVLDSTNDIFNNLMIPFVGGILYDENQALKAGRKFEEPKEIQGDYDDKTELLLFDRSEFEDMDQGEETEFDHFDSTQLDASLIALRMKELMNEDCPYMVEEEGKMRPIQYRDMVILLRSISGKGDTYVKILEQAGIPAHVESKVGYFETTEVTTVLNVIRVIDNRKLDIPLAAVLRSPIGGISSAQLARIVTFYEEVYGKEKEETSLFDKCLIFLDAPEEEMDKEDLPLQNKMKKFFDWLQEIKLRQPDLKVSELIETILKETWYLDFVTAMPGGERRKTNLYMLIEKADEYEKTNYKGLFQFLCYIDRCKKYEVDFGEASLLGEQDNVVRIVSIHKSKGLEYPVVFLGSMSKKINLMDTTKPILYDFEKGIGLDYIDPKLRVKEPLPVKEVIAQKIKRDTYGEELRVLYVALTRAREKLILVGSSRKLESVVQKCSGELSVGTILSCQSYLEWVLLSLNHHKDFQTIFNAFGVDSKVNQEGESIFDVRLIHPFDLAQLELDQATENFNRQEEINGIRLAKDDLNCLNELKQQFNYEYPYEQYVLMKAKQSVSEIKMQEIEKIEQKTKKIQNATAPFEPTLPKFLAKEQSFWGAKRGTAIHKFLELYDFKKGFDQQEEEKIVGELVKRQFVTKEEIKMLKLEQIRVFFDSTLGKRMVQAAKNEELYCEQQFVLGLMRGDEDMQTVQGVIDVFFKENENYIIVDYKTDRMETEQDFIDHYKVQLEYYKETLEQLTGKRVKQCYIYAFHLGKEIVIE